MKNENKIQNVTFEITLVNNHLMTRNMSRTSNITRPSSAVPRVFTQNTEMRVPILAHSEFWMIKIVSGSIMWRKNHILLCITLKIEGET